MLYFAYGSNMSTARLRARVPSAVALGRAYLPRHRLAFHKIGRDGSAKCDIVSDDHAVGVHGVVFVIDLAERGMLDEAEGLGRGYGVQQVSVHASSGEPLDAFAYVATAVDPLLRPYAWYLHHVLAGAIEHALPHDYVAMIRDTVACDDPDRERHARELSIYVDRINNR